MREGGANSLRSPFLLQECSQASFGVVVEKAVQCAYNGGAFLIFPPCAAATAASMRARKRVVRYFFIGFKCFMFVVWFVFRSANDSAFLKRKQINLAMSGKLCIFAARFRTANELIERRMNRIVRMLRRAILCELL